MSIQAIPVDPFKSFKLWGEGPCPETELYFAQTIAGGTNLKLVDNSSLDYVQGLNFYWLLNNLTIEITVTISVPDSDPAVSETNSAQTTYRRWKPYPYSADYSTTPLERVCNSRFLWPSGAVFENLRLFYVDNEERLHWESSVNLPSFTIGAPYSYAVITTADIDLSYVVNEFVSYVDYTIPITVEAFGGFTLYIKLITALNTSGNSVITLDSAQVISAEVCEVADQ